VWTLSIHGHAVALGGIGGLTAAAGRRDRRHWPLRPRRLYGSEITTCLSNGRPRGIAFSPVERSFDRAATWLVWLLLGLALIWGALLVLLSLRGPWGWVKLISIGPLVVALWTGGSIVRRKGVQAGVTRALIGSLGLIAVAVSVSYGWHTGPLLVRGFALGSSSFTIVMVPVVFFLAPAILIQSKRRELG
jgi:hypothetical protein